MHSADKLLTKIHRSMHKAGLVITTTQSPDRSELIGKALCAGMFANLAVAKDKTSLKAGFTLVENFDTAPTDVLLHHDSVVPIDEKDVDTVVFHAKQTTKNGKVLVRCITKVDRSWIGEMSENIKIMKILRSMERVHFEIDLPKMTSKVVLSAVQANIKKVQHEYPNAVINVRILQPPTKASAFCAKGGTPDSTCITGKLYVSCLKKERAGIERRIGQCLIAAQPVTTKTNIDASRCKWLLGNKGANIQALTKQLRDKYQVFVQLAVTQDGFDTPGVLEVVTIHAVSSLVTSDATESIQAQSSGASNIPLQAHVPTGSFATRSTTASADEQTRVKLLSDPSAAAEQSIKDSYQHNGLVTTEGAMMLMAHFITHKTTMFVYGGYIRDFVIYGSLETDERGNVQSDIDISIGQESLESGLEKLSQFAKQHQIKLKRHQLKGPKVLEAFFEPTGGKEFPIELVDSTHFSMSDGKIDFDVNNLKLQPTTSGEPVITHKFANQGGPVAQICHNARHRQLCVMKSPDQISDRIQKMKVLMKTRGWKLLFGQSQ